MGWGEPQRRSPHLEPWNRLAEAERKLVAEKAYSASLYRELGNVYDRLQEAHDDLDERGQGLQQWREDWTKALDGLQARVRSQERTINEQADEIEALAAELLFYK